MRKILKKAAVVLVPLILMGCGPKKLPDIIFPMSSATPRIKYIKSFTGSASLSASSAAADVVFGKKRGVTFRKPNGVHVDAQGKLYVSDTGRSEVFIFDITNKKWDRLSSLSGKGFYRPVGVTTDADGRIYVSDPQAARVRVFTKEGKSLADLIPETRFKFPTGLAVDNERRKIYVVGTHNHFVHVFDMDTLKFVKQISSRGQAEGFFNFPTRIAVKPDGGLVVVDTMNGRVQIFDQEGKFVRAFGQFGDAPGMFARPKGVGIDSEGHIYVVDAAFNVVQIFDDQGRILMSFSGYGFGRGQMVLPAGLAIDKDDYIYVVDQLGREVDIFEFLGDKHKARLEAEKSDKNSSKK